MKKRIGTWCFILGWAALSASAGFAQETTEGCRFLEGRQFCVGQKVSRDSSVFQIQGFGVFGRTNVTLQRMNISTNTPMGGSTWAFPEQLSFPTQCLDGYCVGDPVLAENSYTGSTAYEIHSLYENGLAVGRNAADGNLSTLTLRAGWGTRYFRSSQCWIGAEEQYVCEGEFARLNAADAPPIRVLFVFENGKAWVETGGQRIAVGAQQLYRLQPASCGEERPRRRTSPRTR